MDAHEADLVIFNHELTPRQSQLIGEELGAPVIDRVQLIFRYLCYARSFKRRKTASRAGTIRLFAASIDRTKGKNMSRLGAVLEREDQEKPNWRRIDAISVIGSRSLNELKEVAAHRDRTRQKRRDSQVFQIGLIGYTNAGKSTILNLLTSADTYEQDQLFATLDPLTKRWRLPEGLEVTVTDTVGFIQELPTQLIDAFHSTLEESQNMDLLLHVVDAGSHDRQQQEKQF